MNITNVTVTKTAEEKTANGDYIIEYSVNNGALTRTQATILAKDSPKSGSQQVIGVIYLEQEVVTCNLPKNYDLAPFFADFDVFIKTIRENIVNQKN